MELTAWFDGSGRKATLHLPSQLSTRPLQRFFRLLLHHLASYFNIPTLSQ
jgi:hypothetical protein